MPQAWTPTATRRSCTDGRVSWSGKEVCSGRERRAANRGRLGAIGQAHPQGSRGPGFRGAKEWHEALQEVFRELVETLDDQAELNRRTLGSLQQLVREQSELFRELSRESVDAYDGFLDSLDAYEKDVSNLDVRKD